MLVMGDLRRRRHRQKNFSRQRGGLRGALPRQRAQQGPRMMGFAYVLGAFGLAVLLAWLFLVLSDGGKEGPK